ncbi:LysR family transcriptional regulator [Vibrio profundum]|uniref:LysR family transcriptional regulator n=1 Tax=Vibrio profundum TaxID=2910247 RepID=UPI003D0EE358
MNSIFGSIDDLYLFFSVVEQGSLKSASEKLKIPVSTMSRRLSVLESKLNTRLVEKKGRGLSATETGSEIYDLIHDDMLQFEQYFNDILNRNREVSGRIRITVPQIWYHYFVRQALDEYLNEFPNISANIVLTLGNFLPETEYDLLLTFDLQNADDMIARKLFNIPHGIFASKEFIDNNLISSDVRDLIHLDWICPDHVKTLSLIKQNSEHETIVVEPKFIINDIREIIDFVKSGRGIASLPFSFAKPHADLVQLFPEYIRIDRNLYLVYKERKYQPKAIQKIIDYIIRHSEIWKEESGLILSSNN